MTTTNMAFSIISHRLSYDPVYSRAGVQTRACLSALLSIPKRDILYNTAQTHIAQPDPTSGLPITQPATPAES